MFKLIAFVTAAAALGAAFAGGILYQSHAHPSVTITRQVQIQWHDATPGMPMCTGARR